MTSEEREYREFLRGLHLRHFSEDEIVRLLERTKNGVRNSVPPPDLWHGQAEVLWLIDRMRAHLGRSGTVHSLYRSPAYNAQCPGAASNSTHLRAIAADVTYAGIAPALVASAFRKWRSAGVFSGGIGTYPTFTHVDTRGHKADW